MRTDYTQYLKDGIQAFVARWDGPEHTASREPYKIDTDLLILMGCRHPSTSSIGGGGNLQASVAAIKLPVVPVECLTQVAEYIPNLLTMVIHHHTDASTNLASLLSGLGCDSRWKFCLRTTDHTYALSVAILFFLQSYSESFALDVAVKPDVLGIMNAWLRPADEWVTLPSTQIVAEKMFGIAWCSIALPDDPDLQFCSIGRAVVADFPPFKPGLCPAQDGVTALDLPSLMEMS
jgi:hypothetical protein